MVVVAHGDKNKKARKRTQGEDYKNELKSVEASFKTNWAICSMLHLLRAGAGDPALF